MPEVSRDFRTQPLYEDAGLKQFYRLHKKSGSFRPSLDCSPWPSKAYQFGFRLISDKRHHRTWSQFFFFYDVNLFTALQDLSLWHKRNPTKAQPRHRFKGNSSMFKPGHYVFYICSAWLLGANIFCNGSSRSLLASSHKMSCRSSKVILIFIFILFFSQCRCWGNDREHEQEANCGEF